MLFISKALKSCFERLPSLSVKIPFGHMKGVRWIGASANPGQVFGKYEPEQEAKFIELLQSCNTFWDVGAHVGWYSLLSAKVLPKQCKIFSFEPNPNNLAFLKKHIQLNNVNNIEVINIALSDFNGQAQFSDSAQQSSLNQTGQHTVTVASADSLISDTSNDTPNVVAPDFIKLDVEGAELAFLHGAKQMICASQPRILLSAHGYQKRDQCVQWLEQNNYNIEHLVSNADHGDYVFYATPQ